ncbi:MAG: UDP-N-acetylmuramoyl-L-alanyl-D-glutamate--2,6-diaminopimelate ligase [Candidatus Shapirobacteria bacterium]|jgi:UDP-N-acetylmuramoyl-L-alanyl-D-glutamate--2,6-diaminopimelate ligase
MPSIRKIKNIFWHLPKAVVANIIYQFPSRHLKLIAVTGTDGKTTTATLIHHLLKKSGIKVGLITTVTSPGLHTTSPDSLIVQKVLSDYFHQGYSHVILEVTAHALDQFRFWGCHFQVGVLTNITHEHLDEFKTMENYTAVKASLFSSCQTAILNKDDPSFPQIKAKFPKKIIPYSIKSPCKYQAKNIHLTSNSITFTANRLKIVTDSPYRYQIYNILPSLIISDLFKLKRSSFQKNIAVFPHISGRRQEVNNRFGFKTIVDFAHTPNALKNTLESLKKKRGSKIIVIFGATGGRDQSKRPLMGKVVSELSDIAIITSDDTRSENISVINRQIISGITKNKKFKYYQIENRQEAFNYAVSIAKTNDIIIACGKGHEQTILLGNIEYPWSETAAFQTAFKLRSQKHD